MSVSNHKYFKDWYSRELDALQDAASCDEGEPRERALRHLPLESLGDVIRAMFRDYEVRVERFAEECDREGRLDTLHEFILLHYEIMEKFDFKTMNFYRDMARAISDHFIRKKEKEVRRRRVYISEDSVAPPLSPLSRSFESPISGPPTPCTVLSWINNVSDSTSGSPPDLEPIIKEDSPLVDSPQRITRQRMAKLGKVQPIALQQPLSTRTTRAARILKEKKPTKKEEVSVVLAKTAEHTPQRGNKRLRTEDREVLLETTQASPKKRKTARPKTKPK